MFRPGILAALAVSLWISSPAKAEAALWDWVPRMFVVESTQKPVEATTVKLECRARNAWGRCVVYSFGTPDVANKINYRTLSSFETATEPTE